MINLFKSKPANTRAAAKANYEKAVANKANTRESMTTRVRIALLAKAHLDSTFIEGAEKTGEWQDVCMLAIAQGLEKPEPPTPSYFHVAKLQTGEAYTYIPEEFTDEVFGIGARYQTMQLSAGVAIDLVQRIADEICQKDLGLDAPFKALQFLRDELEFGGEGGGGGADPGASGPAGEVPPGGSPGGAPGNASTP